MIFLKSGVNMHDCLFRLVVFHKLGLETFDMWQEDIRHLSFVIIQGHEYGCNNVFGCYGSSEIVAIDAVCPQQVGES